MSDQFKKHYKKRITVGSSLEKRYIERVEIFILDKHNQIIRDHELIGKLSKFRAFWINGDVRVVYEVVTDSLVIFVDIGTNNQVYS